MNRRILAPAILAALLLVFAIPVRAQETEQDTAQLRRAPRGMMHRDMMHRGMGQMGQRGDAAMGMGALMGAGHVGPRFLIGLKDELELSDDQLTRLEGVQESHHALMTGLREQLQEQAEALREAREADDYDAMAEAIEEAGRLRTQMVRSHLDVERQTLAVLNEDQRAQFETWQEGVRLFRRHGMEMRRQMRGDGDGPGGQMRQRQQRPPPRR